ncbi:MAG: hypothetical protein JXB50_00955 [Spirochaetes bacterium]|nr:hypothetical protein [Spirochaetota bacterium]
MKKQILLFFIFYVFNIYSQQSEPDIIIPEIKLKLEDIKKIETDVKIEQSKDITLDELKIPKPELTEKIKIDLEKTLPEIIKEPDRQKPVDAVITFGYGLNNFLFADFSLFVKQFNPNVSIHYIRESKENLWFNRPDIKNPTSKDDLQAQVLFNYKNFSINSDVGYYSYSFKLQEKSLYDLYIKRILNVDVGPTIRFNNQNELTINIFNSFLFKDITGEVDNDDISRDAFGYILQTDIIYSQIFGSNHFLSGHAGYDFNYLYDLISSKNSKLKKDYNDYIFNNIKAGLNYSTTFKDVFSIKGSFDFLGLFRETEFYWYLLPVVNFGFNLKDYLFFYIDGGNKLDEKPDRFWFKKFDFVIYPVELTPGNHWYAKAGATAAYPGWIKGNVDFEFAYNLDGFNWDKPDKEENLYTLIKATFIELNLNAGFNFTFKDYVEILFNWTHRFYERTFLSPRDEFYAKARWGAPKIGLFFFVDFTAKFLRLDTEYNDIPNLYLMNAGIDWNYQERIGLGVKFGNILFFSKNILFPDYDEPGFEFLAYLKIGF